MPLESHSTEARSLLAALLQSLLDRPEHWYGPMLAENDPASLCKLCGLSENERCVVFRAAGCMKKYGNDYRFSHDAFKSFLSEYDDLGRLQCEVVRRFGHKPQPVLLLGTPINDPNVKTFKTQVESKVLPPTIDDTNDESYDSETMRALDRGGLLYVAPAYLRWAKQLMKTIRASISLEVIRENGVKAQEKAYQHINKDGVLLKLFQDSLKASKLELSDEASSWVFKKIVDFAFHARSEVEWKKYRALYTDRSRGKSKKMGTREFLKAGANSGKSNDDE